MRKIFIFGYGSLINRFSVSKTLNRQINQKDLLPSRLFGYKRIWNYKASLQSKIYNKKIWGVFLNIEESVDAYINGVLLHVSEEEFENLKKREANYKFVETTDIIKVSNNTNLVKDKIVIYTFIAYDPFVAKVGDANTFVMENYLKVIDAGLFDYSEAFQAEFKDTMPKPQFEILDGEYYFNAPEQENNH